MHTRRGQGTSTIIFFKETTTFNNNYYIRGISRFQKSRRPPHCIPPPHLGDFFCTFAFPEPGDPPYSVKTPPTGNLGHPDELFDDPTTDGAQSPSNGNISTLTRSTADLLHRAVHHWTEELRLRLCKHGLLHCANKCRGHRLTPSGAWMDIGIQPDLATETPGPERADL